MLGAGYGKSGLRIGCEAWADFGMLSAVAGEGARPTNSRDEEKSGGRPKAFSAEESIH